MSDPCPNCVELQSELDVAKRRLAEGIESLNAREENSRAEVADLRRQRDDVWAFFKVTSEQELVDKLAALAAK